MDTLKARIAAEVRRQVMQIQIPTDEPGEFIIPMMHVVSDLQTRIKVGNRYFTVQVKEDL